jgi:hypothetical protein
MGRHLLSPRSQTKCYFNPWRKPPLLFFLSEIATVVLFVCAFARAARLSSCVGACVMLIGTSTSDKDRKLASTRASTKNRGRRNEEITRMPGTEQKNECNHATSFCSDLDIGLRGGRDAQLCTRWHGGWSWRLRARSYDSPRGTDSAGARHGKPDSCPVGGTGAANRHRWSELTARFPGLDRNRGMTPRPGRGVHTV